MTVSYNWISEYLPNKLSPEKLSHILTSIGLEVESMENYEEIKGGLEGLLIGEVISCLKHPGADKLSLTKVDVGSGEQLQIVCGAPNVAAGQKVVVAPIGSTIYPTAGEPISMKKAKIRGEESQGMICAADEIGLGTDHSGIMILPAELKVGKPAAEYFKPYSDIIYEIGLTPNRMDAMSHLGVARDVLAWLKFHEGEKAEIKSPLIQGPLLQPTGESISVQIIDNEACQRYSGIRIKGITVQPSPNWLTQKLKSIGVRPINNIVDITNYVLHETGQPLHAFDTAAIKENKIVVTTLPAGSKFLTLDEKERTLSTTDLMICNGKLEPMCIGGVFGGAVSGVKNNTTDIFLESAWFNPLSIRRSSLQHALRTDAATRFEKGVDISQTVNVLTRAAKLIVEIAGGELSGSSIDVYPSPKVQSKVTISYAYLQKLSGKKYSAENVHTILHNLGFEIVDHSAESITVKVPYNKPDISIPADLVEEVMRIDGLDNIEIPEVISIAPSIESNGVKNNLKEKIAHLLTGIGCAEIFTNSITNSAYYAGKYDGSLVNMKNNLSSELDVLRPSMIETGMEVIAYNINRQNRDLAFFEFGKTYLRSIDGFTEIPHLTIYTTGNPMSSGWRNAGTKADLFFLKGIAQKIASAMNLQDVSIKKEEEGTGFELFSRSKKIGSIGKVAPDTAEKFSLKQAVFFLDFLLDEMLALASDQITFKDISKFPAVTRDLSVVVNKRLCWAEIEKQTRALKLPKLKNIKLFDVFEHEKIGTENRSFAISFTFLDVEKTLTDKETDNMMQQIISLYEDQLTAIVRKN